MADGIAITASHVLEDVIAKLSKGEIGALCVGLGKLNTQIWRIAGVSMIPKTDLSILTLVYAADLPPQNTFNVAVMTTRCPSLGEKVLITGFRASAEKYEVNQDSSGPINVIAEGNIILCNGIITQQFLDGRDNFMLPGACLEISCPSFSGMSGGPVFDSDGHLIGVLSSSFNNEDGPSFVSLLWKAMVTSFPGGWPGSLLKHEKTLLDLQPDFCKIQNPEAFVKK